MEAKTCFECMYFSMWDGVCMNPVSRNLWFNCYDYRKDGYKEACEDFEPNEENNNYGKDKED